MTAAKDEFLMRTALEAARRGLGRTSPNPAVGAVLVKRGKVVAVGFHKRAGGDHAEVDALRQVDFKAQGAVLYSTLEPCNHVGRTGPCTQAIINAGIQCVVIGAVDPNPKVQGRGIRRLQKAGLEVRTGVLEADCARLNEVFNHAIVHECPYVVLKMATSLDGRIATRTGASQWITSQAARQDGHRLRDELDAVVVGVGTVLVDNPALTTRLSGGRDPLRIVLDSQLRIPTKATLVRTARVTRTLIATTRGAPTARRKVLEAQGVEVAVLAKDRKGRVDLDALMATLFSRGLNGVLVEGGAEVHGAFLDRRLVHKLVLYAAPLLIGGAAAKSAMGGLGARLLTDALRLENIDATLIGPDLRIIGYAPVTARAKRAAPPMAVG